MYIYIYIHTYYTQMHMCTYIHTSMHACKYIHMFIYKYIFIYPHMYSGLDMCVVLINSFIYRGWFSASHVRLPTEG